MNEHFPEPRPFGRKLMCNYIYLIIQKKQI